MKKHSKEKPRIAVLMGGPSAEHKISLMTGQAFLSKLNPRAYRAMPIIISKQNKWLVNKKPVEPPCALRNIDGALLALHGEYGEDGRIQAFLEHCGIPYTGSGIIASALGMDKLISRKIFQGHGIATPRTAHMYRGDFEKQKANIIKIIRNECGAMPWVIKPRSRGSSVGVSVVKRVQDLPIALRTAFQFDEHILAETCLRGTEITVPILERVSGKADTLPIVEIRPRNSSFFDYREKYDGEDGAEEIVPARITKTEWKKSADAALAAYRLLGCSGYARVDIILSHGTPHVLEINTLPGMTPVSLFPKSAASAKIDYAQLLDILIRNALSKSK